MNQSTLLCLVFFLLPSMSTAQCYVANAENSDIRFEFAIERSTFTGHFTDFDVNYCWQNSVPESGEIAVTVNMASARTGNKDLDIGIQDKQALDADQYPVAKWKTLSIEKQTSRYHTTGELTIRGISRPESGTFRLEPTDNGWRLVGQSQLNRLNYDLGIGEFADTDFIPNPVTVYFNFKLKPVD